MTILKYAVGIDVSKDTLHCCIGSITDQQDLRISPAKPFENSPSGFARLLDWAQQHCLQADIPCWFFMEATGVYYEHLAFFLCEHQQLLCVALPTTVRDFARSTSSKTKTDAVDAAMLTRMALERKLDPWHLPSPLLRQIKLLVRERHACVEQATAIDNRLHALEHSYKPLASSIRRLKKQRALIEEQRTQIERELARLLKDDPDLHDRVEKTASIQGVGILTVLIVLAETNGFVLTRSAKHLLSYAGLDIVEEQSGRHRAPTRISKKGNARLRRALFMPALAAIRHNPQLKAFYHRLLARNGGRKKPALIAVARKLLRLIFTLFRNNTSFDPLYGLKPEMTTVTENPLGPLTTIP
jgi:transposase